MKTLTVEELCKSIIDCPHSTPIWKDSGIRVIRNFNIKKGQLDFSDGCFVDEETYSERTKRALPESDDLVISREAPMGEVCIIPKNLKCCLGQRLVLLKVNKEKCFPKYLLYMMQSKYVQEQIGIINKTGSIVSNLNIPDLKALKIPYRPIESQQKIASVLSALDDKIALNRRMNAKLDQMAKRLYDHWFVQFDFPFDFACFDYAQQPKHTNLLVAERSRGYKSSGGKMVWNETLKREIPAGWEVIQIKDIATLERGISYSKENLVDAGTPMISLASFSPDSSYKENCIKYYQGDIDSCDYLNPYDVLMCTTQQTDIDNVTDIIGKCIVVPDVFREQAVFTTDLVKVKVEQNLGLIISCETKLPWYNKYITGFASGTSIKHLNTAGFLNYSIALPKDVDIINKFANIIINFKRQQSVIMKETQKLTALRDRLLPLLMNGQVEVK